MHASCSGWGLDAFESGYFVCAPCYQQAQEEGVRDACFNWEFMYLVAQGEAPAVWTEDMVARVARVADMYLWDGEHLWLLSKSYPGLEHIIPPIWRRQTLVAKVQSTMGYSGGRPVPALIR